MTTQAAFWDKIAPKYAMKPIANPDAYAQTMARTRSYLSDDDIVMELGCGTGSTAVLLAPNVGRIVGTDISGGMIDEARDRIGPNLPNVSFHEGTGFEDAFKTTDYDAVLAFNLLHLIEDLPAYLSNAHSLMKPGGVFISKSGCLGRIALHWRTMIGVMRLVGKAPFVRFLSSEMLEDAIRDAGFEIIESDDHPARSINHFIVARKV